VSAYHYAAWLCAYTLSAGHADRLTQAQRVACEIAVMRDPERAPLDMIALACQILGDRI
jgi:hypothetical protein